jgi:hypothetical protein
MTGDVEALDGDLSLKENRVLLATMTMKLFDHWQLSSAEQLQLLGLNKTSRSGIKGLREGRPLPSTIDVLDRVKSLLSIHKCLRILLPHDRKIVYEWIKFPNKEFSGMTPLQVMLEYRFVGLVKVRTYLEQQLNH